MFTDIPFSHFMDGETEAQRRTLLGETWAEMGPEPLWSLLLCAPMPNDLPIQCPALLPQLHLSCPGEVVQKTQCRERVMTNDCLGEIIHY